MTVPPAAEHGQQRMHKVAVTGPLVENSMQRQQGPRPGLLVTVPPAVGGAQQAGLQQGPGAHDDEECADDEEACLAWAQDDGCLAQVWPWLQQHACLHA